MDLFSISMNNFLEKNAPLSDRLRPRTIEEFIGQEHIVGDGKFLTRSIKADRISSMIYYGPPGTGKTTLAMVIANSTKMNFEKISAVTSGVKDIREVINKAEEALKIENKRTILFIDEIHRFNKAQQDALLPFVEKGIIILIGATTENPYFEINKALLSRMMVVELKPLSRDELLILLDRALKDTEYGLGNLNIDIDDDAIDYLLTVADGDARVLLNSLEIGVLSTDPLEDGVRHISLEDIKNSIQMKSFKYDKGSDEHYDTISAFIKSMRGSDPDAAVFYLAKMLNAGEDPKFIARRIMIAASEDVGNADPNAIIVATNAFYAVNAIGMPEARIILSQAAIYVACAPKSNSSYLAIDAALEDIKNEESGDIPIYLKDASYSGAKALGRGIDYKYPHDYDNHYVNQNYLPDKFKNKVYYKPTELGHEATIKKWLNFIKKDKLK